MRRSKPILGCHPPALHIAFEVGHCVNAAILCAHIQDALTHLAASCLLFQFPIEELIFHVIFIVERSSAVSQINLVADKDQQISFPFLQNHVFIISFADHLPVYQRTSVRHSLLCGHIAADSLHASFGEKHNIIVKIDRSANAAGGDAGMRRGIDLSIVRIQCGGVVKHRGVGLRRLTEHPHGVVSSHQSANHGSIKSFSVVIQIAHIGRIIQAGVPDHIRVFWISAEKHAVVKHLKQRTLHDCLPVLLYGLAELNGHIVPPVCVWRIRCFGEADFSLCIIHLVSFRHHHIVNLDDRRIIFINVHGIQNKIKAAAVRKERIDASAIQHIDILIGRAAAAGSSADGCGRDVSFHFLDGFTVIPQIVFAVLEVPDIFKNKAAAHAFTQISVQLRLFVVFHLPKLCAAVHKLRVVVKENSIHRRVKRGLNLHARSGTNAVRLLVVLPDIHAVGTAEDVDLISPEIHAPKISIYARNETSRGCTHIATPPSM